MPPNSSFPNGWDSIGGVKKVDKSQMALGISGNATPEQANQRCGAGVGTLQDEIFGGEDCAGTLSGMGSGCYQTILC